MYFRKKLLNWWKQLARPGRITDDLPDSQAAQRDLGVTVTQVRLPSGNEITIVIAHDDEEE